MNIGNVSTRSDQGSLVGSGIAAVAVWVSAGVVTDWKIPSK